MTLGPWIQRIAWGISWLSAALTAVALAVLVHLITAENPARDALLEIALCAFGAIILSVLCAMSAGLALLATPNVPAPSVRADRWDSIGSPFGSETPATRAA